MKIKDLEKYTLRPEDTLKHALEVIETNGKGIAFATTSEGMLLGTVTDGDIRRAILKNLSLDTEVKTIMNENFIFVSRNYTRTLVETIYDRKKIDQIPVVDDRMRLVEIVFYTDFNKAPARENWTILMAGGWGRRLAPLTNDIPKPMLKVGARPILETIIEQLKSYGFKNLLLSLNYKSDIIENYFQDGSDFGVRIEYIKEKKRLGTAGAIKLAREYLDKPFMVVNGDILTKLNFENFMNYHIKHEDLVTVGTRKYELQIPYGVVDIMDEEVSNLVEKPCISYFVNGGIYCLDPKAADLIPDDQYYDITMLISKVLNGGQKVGSFPITEYWMDIGQLEDYNQANNDYERLFGGGMIAAGGKESFGNRRGGFYRKSSCREAL